MIYRTDCQQDYIINTDNEERVQDFMAALGKLQHSQKQEDLPKQQALARLAQAIIKKCGYDAFSTFSLRLDDKDTKGFYLQGFNSEKDLVSFHNNNISDIRLVYQNQPIDYFLEGSTHLFGRKLKERQRNITTSDLAAVYTSGHTDSYYYNPVACVITCSVVALIGYHHLWYCGDKAESNTDANGLKTPLYTATNKGMAYPYIIYAPVAKSAITRAMIDAVGVDNFVLEALRLDKLNNLKDYEWIGLDSDAVRLAFYMKHHQAVYDWIVQDMTDDLARRDDHAWLHRLSDIIGWEKWRLWDKQEVINAIVRYETSYENFLELANAIVIYMATTISRDFIHFCKTNGYIMNDVGVGEAIKSTEAYKQGYEQAKADILKSIQSQTAQ